METKIVLFDLATEVILPSDFISNMKKLKWILSQQIDKGNVLELHFTRNTNCLNYLNIVSLEQELEETNQKIYDVNNKIKFYNVSSEHSLSKCIVFIFILLVITIVLVSCLVGLLLASFPLSEKILCVPILFLCVFILHYTKNLFFDCPNDTLNTYNRIKIDYNKKLNDIYKKIDELK